jgi:uncharacterized protein YyaL (SSP411 family)
MSDIFIAAYNIMKEGNFFEESTKRKTGTNILHRKKPIEEIASQMAMQPEELQSTLEQAKANLFLHRKKRIHPHKDDKILTDWNGLAIAALARASQILDAPSYAEGAKQAVEFILKTMLTKEGRLVHRYRDSSADICAHVDDYAFFIWGLLELYEATFEVRYLKVAITLNQLFISHYWDSKNGGFYFTADDGEELIVRRKEIYDGAIPSGNAVAMLNLLRLSRYTGNIDFEIKASQIASVFAKVIQKAPSAYIQMMINLDFVLGPVFEVVIAGYSAEDKKTLALIKCVREAYLPNKVLLFLPIDEELPEITKIASFISEYKGLNRQAAAYVCINSTCQKPVTDPIALLELFKRMP